MPQPGSHLRAAEEENPVRDNSESHPRRCTGHTAPGCGTAVLRGRARRGWAHTSPQVPAHTPQHWSVTWRWPVAGPANLHPPATRRPPTAPHPRGSGCPRGSRRSWRGHTRILPSARAIYSRDLSRSRGRRPATHPPFLAGLPQQPPPGTAPPPSRGFYPVRSLVRRGSVSGAARRPCTKDVSGGLVENVSCRRYG